METALPQAFAIAIASFKARTAFPAWCPWSMRPPEIKQAQDWQRGKWYEKDKSLYSSEGHVSLQTIQIRKRQKAILMFNILNSLTSLYLSQMFIHSTSFHDYGLRSSRMNLALPKSRTEFYRNSFAWFTGAKIWNDLPNSLKTVWPKMVAKKVR